MSWRTRKGCESLTEDQEWSGGSLRGLAGVRRPIQMAGEFGSPPKRAGRSRESLTGDERVRRPFRRAEKI